MTTKTKLPQVTFLGEVCTVHYSRMYANGRKVIELIITDTDEPMCIASVNVPNFPLERSEVIIKNYSENKGILDVLIEAGIVSKPVGEMEIGHVTCPIVKLLV